MTAGPVLELRHDGTIVARYAPRPGTTMTIGREPDNPVVITDPTVSRHHAELFILSNDSHDILIRDLGSTNGIRVKGALVQRGFLEPGDVVQIGSYELVYLSHPDAVT